MRAKQFFPFAALMGCVLGAVSVVTPRIFPVPPKSDGIESYWLGLGYEVAFYATVLGAFYFVAFGSKKLWNGRDRLRLAVATFLLAAFPLFRIYWLDDAVSQWAQAPT